MTIKNTMAEGTQPTKHQKCDDSKGNPDAPSNLVQAIAVKVTTLSDLNQPKFFRSDSDDEPITPLERKLSDSELTEDMLVPTRDKTKKKKKRTERSPNSKESA